MLVTLRGVLLVPGLGTNLYSIRTATAAGAQVLFSNETVSLSRNGVILLEGSRAGRSLYHLNIQAKEQSSLVSSTALQSVKLQPLSLWHQRFGHLSPKTILKMASLGSTKGLVLFNDKTPVPSLCKGCHLGKMHRFQFQAGRQRGTEIGQLVHSDVCGPMQVTTPGGNRFFVIFKDDYSSWCVTRLLKTKSEVAATLREFAAYMKNQTGFPLVTIRSDNGGEYLGKDTQEWMASNGIRHERSAPYTPQQNGVSERMNRTIMEAARSILHEKQVPLELWGEAVTCATHILNRSLSRTSEVTPFELWHGCKPDVSYFRVFGSPAFVHIPEEQRRKLDQKALKCILVGYCEASKAYRMWNPTTRKLIISRDVAFDEGAVWETQQPEDPIDYNLLFPIESLVPVNIFYISN